MKASIQCSLASNLSAKTNVHWFEALPTHRFMTSAAALGGEVLLALAAFDSLFMNFDFLS